jgi:hypothetical protein
MNLWEEVCAIKASFIPTLVTEVPVPARKVTDRDIYFNIVFRFFPTVWYFFALFISFYYL